MSDFWEYEFGADGMTVWQGKVYNYRDVEVAQSQIWVDEKLKLAEIRDQGYTNGRRNVEFDGTLNIPGKKPNFIDTTYGFVPEFKRPSGQYPNEINLD